MRPARWKRHKRLAVLREHRWSSYRCYAGYERAPGWLNTGPILGRAGGKDAADCAQRYREGLEGYVRAGYKESWARRLRNGLAVGRDAFLGRIKRGVRSIPREWPGKRELRRRCLFSDVVRAVERVKGESWAAFAGRHGDWGRDLALLVARERSGMSLKELGQAAGGMDYGAVSEGVRRMNRRRSTDREITTAYNRTMQLLNF